MASSENGFDIGVNNILEVVAFAAADPQPAPLSWGYRAFAPLLQIPYNALLN